MLTQLDECLCDYTYIAARTLLTAEALETPDTITVHCNGYQAMQQLTIWKTVFLSQSINCLINLQRFHLILAWCSFLLPLSFECSSVKARANARNIVGQQDATLLGPTCCERLHTMLCVVACCCDLLDEV